MPCFFKCVCIAVVIISGSVSVFPGGDAELTFTSTKNRASYECILMDGSNRRPNLTPCESVWRRSHRVRLVKESRSTISTCFLARSVRIISV